MQRHSSALWLFVLGGALVVTFAFWPVLSNGFVNWDDPYNFINNYFFRGLGANQLLWAMTTSHLGVYQPVAWLLLELQYAIFGLKPEAFHLVSLLIHMGNSALLGLFAARTQSLLRARKLNAAEGLLILMGVLLFAVHPLRVEAVAWASCQPYLLCLFFLLASLICCVEGMRSSQQGQSTRNSSSWSPWSPWSLATMAFYLAACLAKATAVFFPLLVLALDYLWKRKRSESFHVIKAVLRRSPYILVAMITAGLAVWARSEIHQSPNVLRLPLLSRLAYGDYAMGIYLSKTALPLSVSNYYPAPKLQGLMDVLLAVLPVACLLFSVYWRKKSPVFLLAFGVFTSALAANLGIFQIGSTVASDRYTYVATAAALCVLAFAYEPNWRLSWREAIIPAVILVLALATRSQCIIWRDSVTLWSDALAKGGGGAEDVHNNLGLAYDELGKASEAESAFKRAVAINPAYGLAQTNLGIMYVKQGRFEEAAKYFATAISLDPDSNEALNGLAYVRFLQGDFEAAAQLNDRALSLRPADLSNLELKAQLETRRGHLNIAIESAKRGLALEPDHPSLLNTLGAIQMMIGQLDEAKISFEHAIALRPEFVEPIVNLADTLVKLGDLAGAQAKYRAALAINPTNARALSALGVNP